MSTRFYPRQTDYIKELNALDDQFNNATESALNYANQAQASADNAQQSEVDAANSATTSVQSASAALLSEQNAQQAKIDAGNFVTAANTSATVAAESATAASSSASSALGAAIAAESSANTAENKASAATLSVAEALNSENMAQTYSSQSQLSATEASSSATEASSSATEASSSAIEASSSAIEAANSAATASSQANNASHSEAAALTAKNTAIASANSAATSESNALAYQNTTEQLKNDAQIATSQASIAASNAATSSAAASLSETSAAQSAAQAAASANYQGVWNSSTNFLVGQSITHQGYFWVANTEHSNSEPEAENSDWTELASFEFLPAIDKQINPQTISAVFVYDTLQDSDNGVWTYQSRHTSWWNENLNTVTRGAKRDFPKIALILVPDGAEPIIYDATEAGLPMWKVLISGSVANELGILYNLASNKINTIKAANGELYFSISGSAGLHYLDFKNDLAGRIAQQASFTGHVSPLMAYLDTAITISSRKPAIISTPVNYIAITPDQLGNNIVFAATDMGLSRIDPDGSVSHWSDSGGSHHIIKQVDVFDGRVMIAYNQNDQMYHMACLGDANIPLVESEFTLLPGYSGFQSNPWTEHVSSFYSADQNSHIQAMSHNALATDRGLVQIIPNPQSWGYGLINSTTDESISGWQFGDIRAAWLGNNSLENISDTNLVLNGTFATSDHWEFSVAWEISAGLATHTTSNASEIQQNNILSIGKTYICTIDISGVAVLTEETALAGNVILGSGTNRVTFVAKSTDLKFRSNSVGTTLGNISVVRAEADLCYKNNALQVNGNISKSPVAVNAELMGYHNFSEHNFLSLVDTSDLLFTVGEPCYTVFWFKTQTGNSIQTLIDWGENDIGKRRYIRIEADTGELTFNIDGSNTLGSSSVDVGDNRWHQVLLYSDGIGSQYIYVDGQLYLSSTLTLLDVTAAVMLRVGRSITPDVNPLDGDICLCRIGVGNPTAEQIQTLYQTEKHLFQANAKFSTSALDIQSVAFDKTEQLLYEGSLSGYTARQDGQLVVSDSKSGNYRILAAQDSFLIQGN